ncbi:MAG TPA: FliA/WhiG family RNA polymerase sigma factor [Bacteroidota bacterium]|nr:FliA/WhiG family RNA polymerase sigma factor [Bacteroidota bacterium]
MIEKRAASEEKNSPPDAIGLLWDNYRRTRSEEEKGQLALAYTPLVRYVVQRFTGIPATAKSPLDREDLTQIGMLGLMDAIERFNPGRGAKFETYAAVRIQGTIQDELRKLDRVSRSDRRKMRVSNDVVSHFENNAGDQAAVAVFAKNHALSSDEYYAIVRQGHSLRLEADRHPVVKDVEELAAGDGAEPEERIQDEEVKRRLAAEIAKLPRRERLVIVLHYYEGLKFTEIADVLDISESRISQIHAAVLDELRDECADVLQ